ncbi:MAG: LysR family transcriptional regulator [Rhodopirellula sp.]|nr:LysR family transcriptional regulator [Rhodopirellula sp.]
MARRKQIAVTPRAKVWFEVEGNYVFGLGICSILEAIEKTGSIKAAAEEVSKSYRHVWSRLKKAEQSLGVSLVETQVGGGDSRRSHLTVPATQLVHRYREMREQVFAIVGEQFSSEIQKIVNDAALAAK